MPIAMQDKFQLPRNLLCFNIVNDDKKEKKK